MTHIASTLSISWAAAAAIVTAGAFAALFLPGGVGGLISDYINSMGRASIPL